MRKTLDCRLFMKQTRNATCGALLFFIRESPTLFLGSEPNNLTNNTFFHHKSGGINKNPNLADSNKQKLKEWQVVWFKNGIRSHAADC